MNKLTSRRKQIISKIRPFLSPLSVPLPSPPSQKQTACVERDEKEGNGSCSTSYCTAPMIVRSRAGSGNRDGIEIQILEMKNYAVPEDLLWFEIIFCCKYFSECANYCESLQVRCWNTPTHFLPVSIRDSIFFASVSLRKNKVHMYLGLTCIVSDYETNTLRFKSIDQWCLHIMMSILNESERIQLAWLAQQSPEQSRVHNGMWNK